MQYGNSDLRSKTPAIAILRTPYDACPSGGSAPLITLHCGFLVYLAPKQWKHIVPYLKIAADIHIRRR